MRLAVLATLTTLSLFAAPNEPVKLDTGLVTGVAGSAPEMRIYKGIPYAAPPVGDLRWKAPKPAAHWDGVRAADKFSPTCMQGNGQSSSEDCLYLNVWTSAKSGEKRPVMLWIYGGGYNTGSGSQDMYDGEALAHKGAVVITINYRLGDLGFFSYPELTKESDRRGAANFGMLDSIAALQWVQRNAAAFGGDPRRVTIFGESAGAGMVGNLMVSPLAKGLFHRAIGESSSWSTATVSRLGTLAEAEQTGSEIANKLGAKSLADLRAKPAMEVLRAGRGTGPVVDGWAIPQDPGLTFAQGKQIDVPVLVGSNRDESFTPQPASAVEFADRIRKRYGNLADTFLKVYPAGSDEEAKDSAFFSGRDEMAWGMRNWARLDAKPGKSKSYVYFFTHQPPETPNAKGAFAPTKHGRATHVSEIPYVFSTMRAGRAWTDADKQLADAMGTYWVNFATTGDPNGKGVPKWAPFDDAKNPGALHLDDKIEMGPVLNASQTALFQAYFDQLLEKP